MRIEEKAGKLIISDFDEFEAYRIASKIEQDGIDFYGSLLAAITEAKVKDGLNFLLGEERKHLAFFEKCLSALRRAKDDPSEDNDLLSSMDYGVFQPYQAMKGFKEALGHPQKALRLGIKIEDNSIKFYESCAENVSSPDTKKEISAIIGEERNHKRILEQMLEGLTRGEAA